MPTPDSHYFDASPAVDSTPKTVELWLHDMHLRITTDRGVFGYGQIDAGTKALLLRVPPPPTGTLVDLGCGAGVIAVAMARRSPDSVVWAIDVNERALALCAANAAANGLDNVRTATPEQVPDGLAVDALWSNPPIRAGKGVLHDMLATWFARLADSAEAWLVVHKHLGGDSLQRWLTERGYPTSRVGSTGGYRILRAQRQQPGRGEPA